MPDHEGLPTESELYIHAITTIAELRAEVERLRARTVPGNDVWVWDSDKRCAKQCMVHSIDIYGDVELRFHGVSAGRWRRGRWHKTREAAEAAGKE